MPKDIAQAKIKKNKNVKSKKPKGVPEKASPVSTPFLPPSYRALDIEERMKTKAEQMKAQLEAQSKVSIMIPLEKGERKGAVQPFCLNGYRFTVPKGVMTIVPEQVAKMIEERFNVELEVRGRSLGQQPERIREALE